MYMGLDVKYALSDYQYEILIKLGFSTCFRTILKYKIS
jgi:hypothetical protein